MGGSKSIKDSIHFHVKSKNILENGVIEITFAPEFLNKIEIKVEDSRLKEWSKGALLQLQEYFENK